MGIVFWFFGIGFLYFFQGTILWLFKYLCSPPPLLHKLDNVVHEDEDLAPEAFGDVSRGVYGWLASEPTNARD